MTKEDKVLNGCGVLFALIVAKASKKNPSEVIDMLNKQEENNKQEEKAYDKTVKKVKDHYEGKTKMYTDIEQSLDLKIHDHLF